MSERLDRKVALVTGATSGIGRTIATVLHAEGAKVVITGRNADAGGELARELGERSAFVPAELTVDDVAEQLAEFCVSTFGGLDVLINNAGVDHTGPLLTTPMDEVRRTFEVNVFAALRMTQACAKRMAVRGGSIVNITSRLASVGVPTMSVYSASKGAIRSLTRAATVELAPFNIRVNDVAPGMTKTPLYDEWLASVPDPDAAQQDVIGRIPLNRLGVPSDVASAVIYLASDESRYVTGITIPVDGGYTAA